MHIPYSMKGVAIVSAFEIIQVIISFNMFIIALITLVILAMNNKNKHL